jgi:hypothetical protein
LRSSPNANRAAWAAILLISICAASADVQNLRFGDLCVIKETEGRMMGFAERIIGEAALNQERLGAVDDSIVNLFRPNWSCERKSSASQPPGRWENNLTTMLRRGIEASFDIFPDNERGDTVIIFYGIRRDSDYIPKEIFAGLSAGLDTSGFHFIQLPLENDKGQKGKNHGQNQSGNRNALPRGLFLALSILLFLIGFKFLDEVVKWHRYSIAGFLVLSSAFMGGAVCAFLYGFFEFHVSIKARTH